MTYRFSDSTFFHTVDRGELQLEWILILFDRICCHWFTQGGWHVAAFHGSWARNTVDDVNFV